MTIEQYILDKVRNGKVHMTLFDPDKQSVAKAAEMAVKCKEAGTDVIMIGGSTGITTKNVDETAIAIKERTGLPCIYFPAGPHAISTKCDAIYFMSIVNSTDPIMITGAHAYASPYIKKIGIEPISMGYIIVEPGMTVGRVAKANLIKRDDTKTAVGYALACQYFGMKFVYLEAGSGANEPVPPKMIADVKKAIDIPLIVGGGIRTPEDASATAKAGADVIVTGTLVEQTTDEFKIKDVIDAIKNRSGQ
ncbi:MAG: geranylgeranylglyceryl/heptaprenylglyceryl phosphate synthase [archaeon]|nr:geranylgeranylglyceryl/heptaprenylglyceryl phosphate synthase [archaeon]